MKQKSFVAKRKMSNVESLYTEIKDLNEFEISRTLVERISSSGDTTGTPWYHFRWKLHFLADYIVFPMSTEDVKKAMNLANKYEVSVTPRGSGSCYYGSGSPSNGGLILDMKRMDKYEVNKDEMTIKTQPGIVFTHLMTDLDRMDLALGCYPTSAYTTTIGGWIGTGGSTGLGTLQNGGFIDQIFSLTIVEPSGESKEISEKKDLEKHFGTAGIFGVITEITFKLYPKPKNEIAVNFGFNNRKNLLECMEKLTETSDPLAIRFSDKTHEIRSTGFSKFEHYLFAIFNGKSKIVEDEIKDCKEIVASFNGVFLGKNYSQLVWDDYLKHEMRIKVDNPVLMLQQIYISFDKVPQLIDEFIKEIEDLKLNYAYYGLINRKKMIRLVFYTPTDNKYWLHFLSSKAVLHKLVNLSYKLGGRVYTYGLQNTIYLKNFEKEKIKRFQELKLNIDPKGILNPLKVVYTKMSFMRINLMFNIAYHVRKLAVRMGKAEIILDPNFLEYIKELNSYEKTKSKR